MSDFYTIKITGEDGKLIENETLLSDLNQNYPQNIGIEKTALRKQINLLKAALLKIQPEEIKNSVYHLKLALLKIAYLILRKGANNYLIRFRDFIEKETMKFISDLEAINQSSAIENKKSAVELAKKVYKDFLNAVIIKSYFPKDQNDQHSYQKISNQGFNRPSHRRWQGGI